MRKRVYIISSLCIVIFLFFLGNWTIFPKYKTVEFPGEGVYTGQLRGQTFHGQGRWESVMGIIYQGEFQKGYFDGYGTMTFANGVTYQGEFKQGYIHGHGVMTYPDGHIHEGEWDADEFLGDHEYCDH